MKTRFNPPLLLLLLFAFVMSVPLAASAQDAEKQKIIDVINTELDAWYKKDKEKWASTFVHSNDLVMSGLSSLGRYYVQRWDSLSAQRAKYFSTPVDPNVNKVTKSDFKVNIKGAIAIVDLVEKGQDLWGPFTAEQTVILEKQGKAWKILRMAGMDKSGYELNETNIEAQINAQGYRLMQLKKLDEAIQVLTLNTQLFPKAYNTWDSLGEAYMLKGEKHIAIGFYQKSIELNPKNENGKKMIEKMGQNQ